MKNLVQKTIVLYTLLYEMSRIGKSIEIERGRGIMEERRGRVVKEHV